MSMARLALYFVCLFIFFLNCFNNLQSNGQLLPEEEVQALQTIAEKLQLKNFNFNQSFCSSGEVKNSTGDGFITNFICNPCNATFCHVTNIILKRQNLTGTLPAEFANLTHLRQIDLTLNYISGLIPAAFARIPLTNLSLIGNRINGSIPKEIGEISTLLALHLDDNDLEGTLPENLGNLSRLNRMRLSANNFTGAIPESFGKLTKLTDFRIDGNGISGTIPNFIGNWTKIIRLDLQGTLLNGPIPNISTLSDMSELRILNLNARAIEFPDLSQMKHLSLLILRNCGITGPIPGYLGGFTTLILLDLSYNMFTGRIPSTFQSLQISYMFLNNNSLSGVVPSWILNNRNSLDLSYNNFSDLSSSGNCQASSVNLVASSSPTDSNLVSWCLTQDLSCSNKPKYFSLFINCGGDKLSYDGNKYEEDKVNQGPAFFSPAEKWAYSSNGAYSGDSEASHATYLATNTFGLNITDGNIYQTARLAPNSIKYYGLCMRRGSYRVRLHFAEIMFSDDETFSSIGKRIFDVAIQGNVVLKDFNIADEAKGVGKGIVKDFPNIHVNGSTLTIDLYWTGKGTNAIPHRGVYGPLISAISVTPNFDVSDGLSAGALAGIVIASCVVLLALILLGLWKFGFIGKDLRDKELAAQIELHTSYFTLRQIKQATGNFDPANKIGEGGFGPVYKGVLSDGSVIAVKQLSSKSKQGNREFVNEIGMISALQHPNLVKLYGCCMEGNLLMLVYEYLENNSLARALFGHEEQRLRLDWPTRKRICIGIAKGLCYLHEESRLKIVHRDIKATNILLDKYLNAKISDFGLAKLDEEEYTHISTRVAGTIGYMAPEYAMRGYLTDKADVYSFGIVTLEIVSGISNTNYRPKEEFVHLLDWAYVLHERGSLLELVDPILGSKYSQKEAMIMLEIGLLCANPSPTLRPAMSSVVSILEGETPIQAPLVKRETRNEDLRFKAFEISHDSETSVSISQESRKRRTRSMDGPWSDSLISSRSGFLDRASSSSRRLIQDLHDII